MKNLYSGSYLKDKLYGFKKGIYSFIGSILDKFLACGLISYSNKVENGQLIDQVGDETRDAYMAKNLIGDDNTYLIANEVLIPFTDHFEVEIKCRFSDALERLGLIDQYVASATDRWYLSTEPTGVLRYFNENTGISLGTTVVDSVNKSIVKLVKDAVSTRVYLNGNLEITATNANMRQENTGFFRDSTVDGSFEGELDYIKITTASRVLTLYPEARDVNGKFQMVGSDGSTVQLEQFLVPVTPLEDNVDRISTFDEIGYTIADGTQYYDVAGTDLIPIGTIIGNLENGKSSAYVTGVHPDPTYIDRVKYNRIVCDVAGTPTGGNWESGTYIRWDQLYSGIFASDLNEATVDRTTVQNKILSYDTIANISNEQQFLSEDKQRIMFFNSPLQSGSDCLYKTMSYLQMNEPYQVQTAEGSGEFENYNVAEGTLYVAKEWVVIE